MIKGSRIALVRDGDRYKFSDEHQICLRTKAQMLEMLRELFDQSVARAEELHAAIATLEKEPDQVQIRVTKVPFGKSGRPPER
jgi:uncharacterized protein Yka (UPF0111/DUF47 family)